jgi:aryl-alcohol dehydrogenase-like predicted oxidoreductase
MSRSDRTTSEAQREWTKRLALGTVQFGMDYGISNRKGQVSRESARQILDHAYRSGIDTLDTAVVYGCSEEVIGSVLETGQVRFQIVSKFPSGLKGEQFDAVLQGSLRRLQVNSLKAYLAHDFGTFKESQHIRDQLKKAQLEGAIHQIGVSVYFPREVEWLLESGIQVDVVQLPFNALDQRFKLWFRALKERNVEIHARSVFLQGLLLMSPHEVGRHFKDIKSHVRKLRDLSSYKAIPLPALLLNHVMAHQDIDKVVIGVTSVCELEESVRAYEYRETCEGLLAQLDGLAVSDEKILVPLNWNGVP